MELDSPRQSSEEPLSEKGPETEFLGHPSPMGAPTYRATFAPQATLTPDQRERMLQLYTSLYELPTRDQFLFDLNAKDEVLLLWCGEELVGFTSFECFEFAFEDRAHRIVFSGDTVVRRDHWGQQALAPAWIHRMGRLQREQSETPLIWFLVVKGHRTFRYLPAFCLHFHPHWTQDTADLQPLAHALARHRYGSDFDAERGVVAFPRSHGHLKPEVAHPTPEECRHPAVSFFLERNPGFLHGDELVCLFPLDPALMRPLARRLFLADQ
jgi:hypothetical protein